MKQYKLLILTDHSKHNKQNSLYGLAKAMRSDPRAAAVDVATRVEPLNKLFFEGVWGKDIFACAIEDDFEYNSTGASFKKALSKKLLADYDAVWLRMPPPLSSDFLLFLKKIFKGKIIINNPKGIEKTSSKAFLMNFPKLCPPMKVCTSIEDINGLRGEYAFVLKPLKGYGGQGIVRVDEDEVSIAKETICYSDFIDRIKNEDIEYLAVKYLKRVKEGDKRIVVLDGKIIGASLRIPARDSWLCNAAMGGSSHSTKVTDEEEEMIKKIEPKLSKLGIVMYGVDTLVGDNGKRVLSEINTTSIGGIVQIDSMSKNPILEQIAARLWKYVHKKTKKNKNVI